jgi:hypothetical protein
MVVTLRQTRGPSWGNGGVGVRRRQERLGGKRRTRKPGAGGRACRSVAVPVGGWVDGCGSRAAAGRLGAGGGGWNERSCMQVAGERGRVGEIKDGTGELKRESKGSREQGNMAIERGWAGVLTGARREAFQTRPCWWLELTISGRGRPFPVAPAMSTTSTWSGRRSLPLPSAGPTVAVTLISMPSRYARHALDTLDTPSANTNTITITSPNPNPNAMMHPLAGWLAGWLTAKHCVRTQPRSSKPHTAPAKRRRRHGHDLWTTHHHAPS